MDHTSQLVCSWVALAPASKPLLVLHAIAAAVLSGAATHNGILAFRYFSRGVLRAPLQRTYASVIAVTYLITFALGLLIYPDFRVNVRAAYLDANVPLATGFFEVKEQWLALGALLAVYLSANRHHADPRATTSARNFFQVASLVIAIVVLFSAIVGLSLVTIRSV